MIVLNINYCLSRIKSSLSISPLISAIWSLSSHLAVVTICRPPMSSLKITNSSFRYSAACLWNHPLGSLRNVIHILKSLPYYSLTSLVMPDHCFHQGHGHHCHRLSPLLSFTPDSKHTLPQIISTKFFESHITAGRTSRLPGPLNGFIRLRAVDWAWNCQLLSALYKFCDLVWSTPQSTVKAKDARDTT